MKTDARIYKGFRDIFPNELKTRWRIMDTVRRIYERYGFMPFETPAIEYVEVLGKFLPESETPDGGIFALKNENDEWVALRYDLTAPLSRVFSMYKDLVRPFKRYQMGSVWRLEKPGPGRYREFMQCDFDSVGSASMAADAEACLLMSEVLEAIGIAPGDYRIRINNRKVLNGLLEKLQLVNSESEAPTGRTLTILRAIDKLDRVGLAGVKDLLGKGRKDPSGDFTEGAGLGKKAIDAIMAFLESGATSRQAAITSLQPLVAGSSTGEAGVTELAEIVAILDALEVPEEQVCIDPTVVRGLAYYTGPVYEGELTFPIVDERGKTRNFGSVFGGGRYDDLVQRFTGERVPATGASIGVDRLVAAMVALGKVDQEQPCADALVTVMDFSAMPRYQRLARTLRRAGLNIEVYNHSAGFRKQLKYADRRRIPLALIAGEDELSRGTVQVKDLRLGRQLSGDIAERSEWLKNRPAQEEVAMDVLAEYLHQTLTSF